MAKARPLKIAVVGGGPAGLEAALAARSAGYEVTLYEQSQPGEFVNRWGFVRMFTPFGLNCTPLGKQTLRTERPTVELPADTAFLTGREFRDSYLMPLAATAALKGCIRTGCSVVLIGKGKQFRLLLRENNAERIETADAVFDCTGTYARPNWVGDGGIPAAGEAGSRQQLAYWLEDVRGAKKAAYAGKSIVLLGGGYSAATTACEIAELAQEHPATWLIWLARSPRSQPLPRVPNDPYRDRDRLAAKANHLAARGDGNLEFHADVRIDELVSHGPDKGFRVAGRIAGKPMLWDVDRVIANVGYRPDPALAGELKSGEPGYFAIGSKGRASLIRDTHEQIRVALSQVAALAKAA